MRSDHSPLLDTRSVNAEPKHPSNDASEVAIVCAGYAVRHLLDTAPCPSVAPTERIATWTRMVDPLSDPPMSRAARAAPSFYLVRTQVQREVQ